jgi:glycosyltransferase involved in cell wall biosynthesis
MRHNITVRTVPADAAAIAAAIRELTPDVLHAHAPGHPHQGDILGEALSQLPKIPLVQTNIFGKLDNPKENAWTDWWLFISWTSCVQAAQRAFLPLDKKFFTRASVAVYPLDPVEPPPETEIAAFRKSLGVGKDEVLFGRLSRPDPNKWTNLSLDGFRLALKRNRSIKFLLREPPPAIAAELRASPDRDHFLILPATSDAEELTRTMASLDAVLHTSSIGESFGYGIAEPMNLGKPVITHSTPWLDQAQLELVRHGECGFVASTPHTVAKSILLLAADSALRARMGAVAREHIRKLADPETSLTRLEGALLAAKEGRTNPMLADDLKKARIVAAELSASQFGYSLGEQLALRPYYYRVRFHQWRRHLRVCPPSAPLLKTKQHA